MPIKKFRKVQLPNSQSRRKKRVLPTREMADRLIGVGKLLSVVALPAFRGKAPDKIISITLDQLNKYRVGEQLKLERSGKNITYIVGGVMDIREGRTGKIKHLVYLYKK